MKIRTLDNLFTARQMTNQEIEELNYPSVIKTGCPECNHEFYYGLLYEDATYHRLRNDASYMEVELVCSKCNAGFSEEINDVQE